MRDFRQYRAWQKAKELNREIYRVSERFPSHERFGLASQIRRASLSIASNIAEGSGRDSDRDFARFLAMALGSTSEVECQLLISLDLDYLADSDLDTSIDLTNDVRRLLIGLRNALLAG